MPIIPTLRALSRVDKNEKEEVGDIEGGWSVMVLQSRVHFLRVNSSEKVKEVNRSLFTALIGLAPYFSESFTESSLIFVM